MRAQLTGLGFSDEMMKQNEKDMDKLNELMDITNIVDKLEYEIVKIGGFRKYTRKYSIKGYSQKI